MKTGLLLLVMLGVAGCHPPAEEAAIKHVLEQASATWRAGDVPGHAACWHLQPYSRVLVSLANGRVLDIPPARLLAASPQMGQGGHEVNTNYHISISGRTAWVSHDQEATAKNGTKVFAHNIRLLEKIDDHWKLVGQSIHLYTP